MPSRKIRAVLFDIGRVLIRVDIGRATRGLASGLSISRAEVWSAIENDPRWHDWQEGRMTPRDWHLHLNKRLGTALSFEQFAEVWNRALDPRPIHDSLFLEELSKGYRLALLSNTDPLHVAHAEATYDFYRFFPVRVYSCTVGASKPNPHIYQEALRGTKVRADQAVYIDDAPPYVEAARRLGITGIDYVSPTQLQADLRAAGVAFR